MSPKETMRQDSAISQAKTLYALNLEDRENGRDVKVERETGMSEGKDLKRAETCTI